jgi:hypothetical protein
MATKRRRENSSKRMKDEWWRMKRVEVEWK